MNRMSETFNMLKEASESGVTARLSKKENWTPDLVHVHVTRLVLGLVLGFLLACSLFPLFAEFYK